MSAQPDILTSGELAERLKIPERWIRDQSRGRRPDPIPCARFGKYTRFDWNDPELRKWLARHGLKI
jgi:hypothetical protein